MAGYTQTPLFKKMGIQPTTRLYVVNAPHDYMVFMETDIANQLTAHVQDADMYHIFAQHKTALAADFNNIIGLAKNNAVIWVSWYKKASKIPTDITEDTIRDIVLPTGWVDVKVCAVSDTWSGLKIVKRVKNR